MLRKTQKHCADENFDRKVCPFADRAMEVAIKHLFLSEYNTSLVANELVREMGWDVLESISKSRNSNPYKFGHIN